jgi:hypothetical protein
LKTGDQSPQVPTIHSTSDYAENSVATGVAFLASKSPDLALVVERWETLPEVVKAGILAMLNAVRRECS